MQYSYRYYFSACKISTMEVPINPLPLMFKFAFAKQLRWDYPFHDSDIPTGITFLGVNIV